MPVVLKIVDGDTIDVGPAGSAPSSPDGHAGTRIRLIGVNTPESVDPRRPVECFGKEASKHTAELIPVGTPIRMERDVEAKDRYGRTLAYVYRRSDNLFVNLQLVADGYGQVMSIPPNVTYADAFRTAERSARSAGLGLWAACDEP